MPEVSTALQHAPTLQLADGETIHCGPENGLLRHFVEQLLEDLNNDSFKVEDAWLPLVLYGDSLCGKSLVAHGLANAWKQTFTDEKTVVLTAADLARSLARIALGDDSDRLTRQMRSASLLVVDDVQHLKGKVTADTWLTGLLDYRARHRKPTIVTANRNIASTPVSGRLCSRLAAGLSICISLPYAATRKQVILRSAQTFDVVLVDETVDQLVELTNGKPVSGIQSVVASVASSDADSEDMDLAPMLDNQDDFLQQLIRTTARRFGVRVADMKGSSRRKNTVLARAISMFLIREITPLSLVEVGRLFGGRDHSTVRHACEKIRGQLVSDDSIREAVSSICHALQIRLPSSWFELLDDQCA